MQSDEKVLFYDPATIKSVIAVPDIYLDELCQKPKKIIVEEYPNVCVLGGTGSGKSAFCNTLIGDSTRSKFPESSGINSFTYATKGIFGSWFGKENNKKVIVLDTPGLGDTQEGDTTHIAQMVTALQAIEYVHSFVLCFNSQMPRFDQHLQDMLTIFQSIFSKEFFKNIVICFTRFSFDERSKASRKKGGNQESLIKQYIAEFNSRYGFKLSEKQFIFVDNDYNDQTMSQNFSQEELNEFNIELKKLQTLTESNPPFYCHDIQEVLSTKDRLRKELENQKVILEKEKEKYEGEIKQREAQFAIQRKKYIEELQAIEKEKQKTENEKKQIEMDLLKIREENKQNEKQFLIRIEDIEKKKAKLQEESLQTKRELQAEVRKFEEESKKSQAELINQKKEIALQNQKLNEKMWCDLEKSKGDLTQQVKILQNSLEEMRNNKEAMSQNYQNQLDQQRKNYEKKIESTKDSMKNISDQMENLRNLTQKSNQELRDRITKIKETCVHCGIQNPTGRCGVRKHTPNTWIHQKFILSGYMVSVINPDPSIVACCRDCDEKFSSGKFITINGSNFKTEGGGERYEFYKYGKCNHQFP